MTLTQIPESGLKLADVVKFDPLAQPWNKLSDCSRFSIFHAKFWGKSMGDEEREWLNLMGQSPDHSTDDDVIMDDGYNTDTDGDDEFISGCYELDINPNPVSDVRKIWIRADYIRVYKYTESKYDLCYKRGRAQAVVLTGQPGIGKTVCLLYILRRRCAEKKPVIWNDGRESYVFVDDGVFKMTPDSHINEFNIFVWTLVDSDGVPPALDPNRTRLFVLCASSPNRSWRRLHKTVDDINVVLNPWTWREMRRALPILLPGAQFTDAEIKRTFEELGPTPRIIRLLDEPDELEQNKQDVDTAISDFTLDKLKEMVNDARSLSQDENRSNKLSLVCRIEHDNMCGAHAVASITKSIQSRLAHQLRTVSWNQLINLYNLFSKSPQTKNMCGILFEAIGLCAVPEELEITLLPMVRLPQSSNAKLRPRWYTSHAPLTNKTLEAKRKQALRQSQTIQFPPITTQEFKTNEILSLCEGVFYVPVSENQEELDAFLLFNGILYILQFTVDQGHSIKTGFVEFLQKCQHVPPLEEWKFVFLIPPGITLLCPEPESQLPSLCNLNPYSAELDLETLLCNT